MSAERSTAADHRIYARAMDTAIVIGVIGVILGVLGMPDAVLLGPLTLAISLMAVGVYFYRRPKDAP